MKNIYYPLIITLIGLLTIHSVNAQDELFELLQDGEPETTEYVTATYKSTRLVIGQSSENPAPGVLQFMISHHFGRINTGFYDLFGLDQATIRIGFDYGITDRLSIGFGRSSWEKTYDGYLKYKILRQSTGLKKMPVSLVFFSSIAINGLRWEYPERTNYFSSRVVYTFQLLLARKFSERLSLQLVPSLVHKNIVPTSEDKNDIFLIGGGGRYKFAKRASINIEYHYVIKDQIVSDNYNNSLSIGFDIETGGHVFQMFFTNSFPLFERGFLTETEGLWTKGDIFFGFNISRVFTIIKPKEFKDY